MAALAHVTKISTPFANNWDYNQILAILAILDYYPYHPFGLFLDTVWSNTVLYTYYFRITLDDKVYMI